MLLKILGPLVALGMVLCTVMFWAVSAIQQTVLQEELAVRAEVAVATLEQGLADGQEPASVLGRVQAMGQSVLGIGQWHLVDLSGQRILADSADGLRSRPLAGVKALQPLVAGQTSWQAGDDGMAFAFVLPVRWQSAAMQVHAGGDVRLVAFVDAAAELAVRREKLVRLLGLLLAVLMVFAGVVVALLRHRVISPLGAIRQSLAAANPGDASLPLDGLQDDELGELGASLQRAFERLSHSERFIASIFQSLSGCAYSVDARTGQVLQYTGNMDKQADGRSLWNPLELDAAQRQELGAATARGEPWNLEYLVETGGGAARWVNNRGRLIRNADGAAASYDGLVVDVTDQRLRSDQVSLFSEALRKSSNEVYVVDLESQTLRFANAAALRNIGYTLEELVGLPNTAIAREMLRPEVVANLAQQLGEREEIHYRYEHTRKDGSTYPFEFVATPVDQGGHTRFIVVGSDITDRLRREALIRSGEERLKLALEGSDYGMFVFDSRTGESYVSDSIQQWTGVAVQNVDDIGQLIAGIAPEYRAELQRQLSATSERVREFNVELSTEGDRRCLHVRGKAHYNEAGQIERLTGFAADVTRQNIADQELHRALEAAQAATRAKSEFLATMSHEIRTPMNGVLGMTQLLLDMQLTPAQQETAALILRSGEALLAIINDILDFSKIEAGKLDLESVAFDLEQATREVMELMSGNARSKSLDLYVDYSAQLAPGYVGDEGRIRQILLNLVGNAIKFTAAGHVVLSVQPVAAGRVRFSVRDTGQGIPDGAHARLFDSFTQGDASTTRKFGGTGLGLAICKKLVQMMDGEIGVDSVAGHGATFWFVLPLKPAEEPLVPQTDTGTAQPLAAVRVLIVDDNTVGRDILRTMLSSLGAIVTQAGSAAEARVMAIESLPDLLVVDYHMPEVDGLSLVRTLRAHESTAALRIVMLSSSDIPRDQQRAVRLDGWGLKPVMKRGLLRLCLDALSGGVAPDAESLSEPAAVESSGDAQHLVRVLLAEDNAVNQKVAVRMLEKLGCRVDVAANGKEAVELWKQFPYTMIFMDCQMPEIDGLTATRMIRAREGRGEHIPIVAMTANAMDKDREECLSAGMDDYASKPVKLDILGKLVERYAGRVPA